MTDIRAIAVKIMEQQASAEELALFRQYLASRQEQAAMTELFPDDAVPPLPDVIRLEEEEKQSMLQYILSHTPQPARKEKTVIRRLLAPAAAVFLLCIGVSGLLRWIGSASRKPSPVIDVYTAYGRRKVLVMPDSTRIVLNAGSRLRYTEPDAGMAQEFFLEGEAFFDVAPLAGRAFTVHSGRISTRVLGTSFNVRAYSGDTAMSVQVKTGKVQVMLRDSLRKSDMVTLAASQQVVYTPATGRLSPQPVNGEDVAGWTANRLIFHDQPAAVILNELERIYDIRFNAVNKKALACRYTIRLRKLPLAQTLETISVLTGMQFHSKDSVIIVK